MAVVTVVVRVLRGMVFVIAGAVLFVFVMLVMTGTVFVSGHLMQDFFDKFTEHLGDPPCRFVISYYAGGMKRFQVLLFGPLEVRSDDLAIL